MDEHRIWFGETAYDAVDVDGELRFYSVSKQLELAEERLKSLLLLRAGNPFPDVDEEAKRAIETVREKIKKLQERL